MPSHYTEVCCSLSENPPVRVLPKDSSAEKECECPLWVSERTSSPCIRITPLNIKFPFPRNSLWMLGLRETLPTESWQLKNSLILIRWSEINFMRTTCAWAMIKTSG